MKNRIVVSCTLALLCGIFSMQATDSLERVVQGINACLSAKMSAEERRAVTNIEERRKTLAKDQTPLGTYTVAHSAGKSSMTSAWGKVLFQITKAWQPEAILEIGTCIGVSSAYVNAALNSNNFGSIISLERCDLLVPFVKENWKFLGVERAEVRGGDITSLLAQLIDQDHAFDLVFDDEKHQEKETIEKFEQLLPTLTTPVLYVFDDIAWSDGMKRAWSRIKQYDQVAVSIALGDPRLRFGICIIDPEIKEKQNITIKLNKAKRVDLQDSKIVVCY